MKYEIIRTTETGETIFIDHDCSRRQAINAAKEAAKEYPTDQVYIQWYRASDGQHGYLNPGGGHDITGRPWENTWGGSRPNSGRKPTLSLRDRAERRVNRSPQLSRYHDIIFYDWPEGDEHLRWVLTAPVREIVSWAETAQEK